MKIQKFFHKNDEIVQIYISESEQKDLQIIEKINESKNKYSNISIFVSGEKDTIKTIKETLDYEKSRKVK